jgi:hypothetical protein
MKDFLRTLFRIRTQRRSYPITTAPKVGSEIICRGIKMTVSRPIAPELWDWLLLSGWRAVPVRDDRRAAVSLPEDTLRRLEAANAAEREVMLGEMLQRARRQRATARN